MERKRKKRLSQLGVSATNLKESALAPLPAPLDASSVRFLQYNILADGLADDGFLVKPVLAEWPAGPGNVPTSDGAAVPFNDLIQEMLAAKGNSSALEDLKKKYDVPDAQRNFNAVSDWEGRLLQIQLLVKSCQADILVFQEVDHYGELLRGLEAVGYTSRLPNVTEEYKPAHLDGFSDKDEEAAQYFHNAWASRGYAFRPMLGSTNMWIYLGKEGLDEKILSAAEAEPGLREKLTDPKKGKLDKNWCSKARGSLKLMQAAGIKDPSSLDDMGTAIFWRKDRFDVLALTFRSYQGSGGIVQVRLKEKGSGRSMIVIGTHLGSGDDPKDEDDRLASQVACGENGLSTWVSEGCRMNEPLILCMDANSHPQIKASDGSSSCWKTIRSSMGASVWDAYFDVDGVPKMNDGLDPPVTSNKVRGPLSGQAKKIGNHAYYCIDHVYYNPSKFNMVGHVFAPKRFASSKIALESVQPSLNNPSDHFPVIVDLAWRSVAMKVTNKQSVAFYIRAAATFLRGTNDKPPAEELMVSALGAAIPTAVTVAIRLEKQGLARISEMATHYPMMDNSACAQIAIALQPN